MKNKIFVIFNSQFEEVVMKEVFELTKVKPKLIGVGILELGFDKKALVNLCYHGQSFERILIGLEKVGDWKKISFKNFGWQDFFPEDTSFKIDVLGVKGNENRLDICKNTAKTFFSQIKNDIKIDMKTPEQRMVIYFDQKN